MAEEFASEGFDLDALPAEGESNEVVFEIGGKATGTVVEPVLTEPERETKPAEDTSSSSAIATSEAQKAQGNDAFKRGNYLEAYDMYTDAIESCPGISGSELLTERDAFNDKLREEAIASHRQHSSSPQDESGSASASAPASASASTPAPQQPPPVFQPPPHEFGKQLSVYHSNRAACLLYLGRYDEAISDCDIALLLNPAYVKALLRRMQAYENSDRTEDALQDAKKALLLEPKNVGARKHVTRLQKIEDERLEKLKEETMAKLKDLGNSILGNFGLSLDNFKTEKDPNTGSHSISFSQNK
eukprot:CAMPEP_0198286654 /NCGR_PEP_ID=MMETSP1449-20131203/5678_1 /TAXON_ID=420275 /ORGANISM="Attheya septentrionalis, Strain CCMP2084" /LENGTH=301 /DNA_ID=CAMNT_0043984439 /DNA_START=159 /DNA_END=1064 /DNA_ORIENTATION=+